MSVTAQTLLPPRAAALAKRLEFLARTRVEGFLKSTNRSKQKGQSTDFLQHREYVRGDDLRSLDWRVFGRSDRLVVREHEEYTNLDTIVCLDVSGSMVYAGQVMSKIDFCRHCVAMLCYVLDCQRDRYGLATLADGTREFTRPGTGRRHFARLLRQLASSESAGETDICRGIRQLAPRVRRRSVFVVFSDCYQAPDALVKALGLLTLQGHDVILYQVYEQQEADFLFSGFTLFRDVETGELDAVDPAEIREAYRHVFRTHTDALRGASRRFGIEFHSLPVQEDWDLVLAGLLRQRRG